MNIENLIRSITLSSHLNYPITEGLKAILQPEVVNGFINLLEEFDAYEERKAVKNADAEYLDRAYKLYQQGRLSKQDLHKTIDLLCGEKRVEATQKRHQLKSLLDEID